MKKTACLAAALSWLGTARGQTLPPPVWVTNYGQSQIWQVCSNAGVLTTNPPWPVQYVTSISSNGVPFADKGLGDNWTQFWPCSGVNSYNISASWTWNDFRGGTNYLVTTNWNQPHGPIVNGAEQNYFYLAPYPPPPSTNSLYHHLWFHTDGNTLSFANKLTGPWSWSGSRDYNLYSYGFGANPINFVQGVSTDGSVSPVSTWWTNQTIKDGVVIKTETHGP